MTLSLDGPASLRVVPSSDSDGLRVQLRGELDRATAGRLVEIVGALAVPGTARVRLDLADLDFIDAAGLAALLQIHTSLHRHGGRLRLVRARPLLRRMLAVTSLLDALDVEPAPPAPESAAPQGG